MDNLDLYDLTICDLCTHYDNRCKSELIPSDDNGYSGFQSSYNDQF